MRKRRILALACFCRSYLYINGFLSDVENDKVHNRIRKYQDLGRIEISDAQLKSVRIKYNDNAK